MSPKAVILGCAGPALSAWERDFFARVQPFGFILFQRNCQDPAQVRALVDALRDSVGRPDAPVLIDQEGGRVARLKPPHWRAGPPAARFGALARTDPGAAREAVRLHARLLADELLDLGITVDCAPVLDLPAPGGHDVIGDRAFCADADVIAALGRAFCEGLLEGGVLPVIKHIPGHGRATVDSHHDLPVVSASRAALEASDFRTFRALADAPWAMTAHVVYTDIDPDRPATTSRRVIEEIVRGHIGFDGVLVSDDLSMQALAGGLGERTEAALAAGCDLALHCNGKPDEMAAVADAAGPLGAESRRRIAVGARRAGAPSAFDAAGAGRRIDALLGAA